MKTRERQKLGQPKQKLSRDFYTRRNVVTVARDLLGKLLVVPAEDGRRVSGTIVEVEAYRGPQDRAAHSFGGRRTKRTETMYGIGGTAYVFFVYGMYYQFNVVTNAAETPGAIAAIVAVPCCAIWPNVLITPHTAGGSPANGRALTELSTCETDDAAHRWRSSHLVNLHIA